jgi:hypothetical protein
MLKEAYELGARTAMEKIAKGMSEKTERILLGSLFGAAATPIIGSGYRSLTGTSGERKQVIADMNKDLLRGATIGGALGFL